MNDVYERSPKVKCGLCGVKDNVEDMVRDSLIGEYLCSRSMCLDLWLDMNEDLVIKFYRNAHKEELEGKLFRVWYEQNESKVFDYYWRMNYEAT